MATKAPSKAQTSNINQTEFPAPMEGINQRLPAHAIPLTQAVYLNDVLQDEPGICRRRGPVTAHGTAPQQADNRGVGMFSVTDRIAHTHVGVIMHSSTDSDVDLRILNTTITTYDLTTELLDNVTTGVVMSDCKPLLNGGTCIGVSSHYSYNAGIKQAMAISLGATKANYTTGTVTTNRNSKAVTGSGTTWTTNVEEGMFLLDNNNFLVGVVKSVDSNTTLTLEQNALFTRAAVAYTLTSLRGLSIRAVKGHVTTSTSSTTVTGAETKFSDQGLGTGTWHLFRARDYTYIGQVSTVTNNTSLTLTGNAGIATNLERYVAIKEEAVNGFANLSKVGWLNATHAGVQWFANLGQQSAGKDFTTRLFFSDDSDPEAVDLSEADGDFLQVTSAEGSTTPIIGIASTNNSLAIFKEDELFALYGNNPEDFQLRKIEDIGALSNQTIQPYAGGVIFASRQGIHFFDGIDIVDLDENLGDYWERGIESYKVDTHRSSAMIYNGHYFVYTNTIAPAVGKVKNASTTTPTRQTICINIATRACVFMQNINIFGSVRLPSSTGEGTWFIVHNATPRVFICEASALFDSTGADGITCEGDTIGPDFYIDTPAYDLGDAALMKHLRHLYLHYLATGDTIRVDIVKGLNPTGVLDSDNFPISATFTTDKMSLDARSTHFRFRIYQNSTSVTDIKIGVFAMFWKRMRMGRY